MDVNEVISITIRHDSVSTDRYPNENAKDIDELVRILGYFVPDTDIFANARDALSDALQNNDQDCFYEIVQQLAKSCKKQLRGKKYRKSIET